SAEGYQRVVIDDDGDRPVAILDRRSPSVRVTAGSDLGDAALELAPESARRVGIEKDRQASGLLWGATELAPVELRVADRSYAPDWGDDGRMGLSLMLRFHVYVNMPQRWVYLQSPGDLRSAPGVPAAAGVTPTVAR